MRKTKTVMPTPEQVWQTKRRMNGAQYKWAIRQLRLTKAAASRVLGVAQRTSYRYANDEAEIPIAQVLLLRAMIHYSSKPLVPRWSKEQN